MKMLLLVGSFGLALGISAAGGSAETNPGNQPPAGKGGPKTAPVAKTAPLQPVAHPVPSQPAPQAGAAHPGGQPAPTHAGPPVGHASANNGLARAGAAYGATSRWARSAGYARPYGMAPQRFGRYGVHPSTWSPRYAGRFVEGDAGRRSLRYGYATRSYGYGSRYQQYAPRPAYHVAVGERRFAYRPGYRRGFAGQAYTYRRPAYSYAPRFSYYGYGYRPRVRYAYAETPYAYDLPRETYATGIFATNAALGLHTYDYAYTTQVRPIAAYGGPTGSYAGGYPIYNRPLAPAYPTPGCDCD
jgi:hypothetical protein